MSTKKVIITVEPDGSTSIDAQGFTGSACSLATKELEMVLAGGNMTGVDDRKKPDFYATRTGTQSQHN